MTIKNHLEAEDMAVAAFYEAAEKTDTIYSWNVTEKAIRGAVQSTFEILSRMDDNKIIELIRKGKTL